MHVTAIRNQLYTQNEVLYLVNNIVLLNETLLWIASHFISPVRHSSNNEPQTVSSVLLRHWTHGYNPFGEHLPSFFLVHLRGFVDDVLYNNTNSCFTLYYVTTILHNSK